MRAAFRRSGLALQWGPALGCWGQVILCRGWCQGQVMRTVGCTYEFNVLEAGYAALWEPYVGKQRSSAMYASVWELLVGKM